VTLIVVPWVPWYLHEPLFGIRAAALLLLFIGIHSA
jgi:hypothetical protein